MRWGTKLRVLPFDRSDQTPGVQRPAAVNPLWKARFSITAIYPAAGADYSLPDALTKNGLFVKPKCV